ncbi:hypothetical protein HanPI659440_Chr10g0378951 [Helianthus annuus]|nr:hypothetical protein HanPI659440_Chr10g0378951 [Helianthus annuus]
MDKGLVLKYASHTEAKGSPEPRRETHASYTGGTRYLYRFIYVYYRFLSYQKFR